jgi:predicted kinase
MVITKPTLFLLYGYPGSGKTYVARQLGEELGAAHVQADRIRYELFEEPRYDTQENQLVTQLMNYMTEEFLKVGTSVIYDTNALRQGQRKALRDLAHKSRANVVLIWIQVDIESAYIRAVKRDLRKIDDKYAAEMDRATYQRILGSMQNPMHGEEYVVISGKHTFQTQRGAIIKKLFDIGLLSADQMSASVVKPGLVNLVPNPLSGRVDETRRNISIR